MFDSFDGGTGASITLTGLAITDVEIYKGTSMTQRASDAGVVLLDTDGIDIDGITGIHGFSIDTGDNTDAGFYAVGSFFTVIVSAVTIDAQTVNFVAGTFRLLAAETASGTPQARASAVADGAISAATLASDTIAAAKIATGAITAAKFAAGAVDAAAIANGAIDAATFAADVDAEILSYIVDDATRIDASALNTASVTTIPAILDDTDLIDDATSGLAKIATDAAAILVDTAVIGAAGAGLTEAGGDGDHLTAINLPNQTMDITGSITGNLSGSVGSVTGAVGSVTGAVGSVTGDVGGLAAGAIADVWTTALTEAYAADGAAFTGAQALFMVWAFLAEKAIVTTTLTANQLDGVTPAMTFTLDDGTNPTSLTRAT
jgi:hypothetical protein